MASQQSNKTVLLALTATVLATSAISLYLYKKKQENESTVANVNCDDDDVATVKFSHTSRVIPVDDAKDTTAKDGDVTDLTPDIVLESPHVVRAFPTIEKAPENPETPSNSSSQNPQEAIEDQVINDPEEDERIKDSEVGGENTTAQPTEDHDENPLVSPDKMKSLQRRAKKNGSNKKGGTSAQVSAAKKALSDYQATAAGQKGKKNKKKKAAAAAVHH